MTHPHQPRNLAAIATPAVIPAPDWLRPHLEAADGFLSFERFMDLALHDPVHGYYTRRASTIGPRGDFTTAALIAPALAKAVAAWILARHRATGIRDVIEPGPGTGALARAVRDSLPWTTRRHIRFHFVESSIPLRAIQQKLLGTRQSSWHPSIQSSLTELGGTALVFSNEFLDTFPVRRFRRTTGGWEELGVSLTAGGMLAETSRPAPAPPAGPAADSVPAGHVHEIHDSIKAWLVSLAEAWKHGAMLTIDYGSPTHAHDPRRPLGTARGYFLQQRLEGHAIYQNPGRLDLTADVRFADLVVWGQSLGLHTVSLTNQAAFLAPFADPGHPGDRAATDPSGAGSAFQVLVQTRA